jgi:hypothetical protein
LRLRHSPLKFRIGEMPSSPSPGPGDYHPVREPDAKTFEVIATSGFAVLIVVASAAWHLSVDVQWGDGFAWRIVQIGFVAAVLVPVHELSHAVCYPNSPGEDVVIGFSRRLGMFYAGFNGEISRTRSTVVYLFPFLVLSILPFLVALSFDFDSEWLALFSIINAGFSGADLYSVALVISQVPRGASVRNSGWNTYWRFQPAELSVRSTEE